MNQPEVVRPVLHQERHIRPPDVDEPTWNGLKNATRWMLVQKYGPTAEQLKQERQSA